MDDRHFDAWSRTLATPTDRRKTLRGLVAVALGSAGALAVVGESDAAIRTCRRAAQKCVRNGQCCSGMCATDRAIPRSQRNRCVCGELNVCGGECVDQAADPVHCGACDVRCHAGETCCDGQCVDLDNDSDNCGVCGRTCDYCLRGYCYPSCSVKNSGMCGGGAFCVLDIDEKIWHVNSYGAPGFITGCAEANGPTCPTGTICGLGDNWFGWAPYLVNDTLGMCVTLNECTP